MPAARTAAISSAARPEHEGVAAFEAHYPLPFGRLPHEDAVDLGLVGGNAVALLAGKDADGIAAGVLQDRSRHEAINDDDIRLLQALLGPERQQVWVTWACADERYAAHGLASMRCMSNLDFETLVRRHHITGNDRIAPRPAEQVFPQPSATDGIIYIVVQACAQRHGLPGDFADARRQKSFDLGANVAGENRRCPFAADGDDDRIPIDQRRDDEGACSRVVDHIDLDTPRRSRRRYGHRQFRIVTSDEDEARAIKVSGRKRLVDQSDRMGIDQGSQLWRHDGADDGETCCRLQQQAQLLDCLLATTDDRN